MTDNEDGSMQVSLKLMPPVAKRVRELMKVWERSKDGVTFSWFANTTIGERCGVHEAELEPYRRKAKR